MSLIVSYISIAGRLRQQGVSVCVCGAFCVPDCQLHQRCWSTSSTGWECVCVCVCGVVCVPDVSYISI